jgi:hypothetical protein
MSRADYMMQKVLNLHSEFTEIPNHESYADIEENISRLKEK